MHRFTKPTILIDPQVRILFSPLFYLILSICLGCSQSAKNRGLFVFPNISRLVFVVIVSELYATVV
jgi:hypothetical protein